MENNNNSIITTQTLFNGYSSAYKRYTAVQTQSDPEILFFPLFESLNWAVTIDDKLKKDNPNWHHRFGKDGEIIKAIRHARNRVHHQWADAIYKSSGAALPLMIPFALMEWNWKSVIDLPPEDTGHIDTYGAKIYEERLGKKPIRFSLGILNNFYGQMVHKSTD